MTKWRWTILIVIMAIGAVSGVLSASYYRTASIKNFSDCVGAGYSVSQTYPLQCVAHGKVFAKEGSDPVEAAVQNVVANFGGAMQLVSTDAAKAVAAQAIEDNYRDLVSPSLLAAWMNDPAAAPGKKASGSWPDHIDITSISRVGTTTYAVAGNVMERMGVTNTPAGEYAVTATVDIENGNWVISSWSGRPS